MLLVIADTSPIRYLVQIGHIDVLYRLFEQVFLPREVASELSDVSAPAAVQAWIHEQPSWLKVMEVESTSDPTLTALDAGSIQRNGSGGPINRSSGRRIR